jgi:hypothetical protein
MKPFLVCAHVSIIPTLENWGKAECKHFESLKIRTGMPKDWRLFLVREVTSNKLMADFPVLSPGNLGRIQIHGGVRISKGNRFFSFSPPTIRVLECNDDYHVVSDQCELRESSPGEFAISPSAPKDTRIDVALLVGGKVISRKSLVLQDDFRLPAVSESSLALNSFGGSVRGTPNSASAPTLIGAAAHNLKSDNFTRFSMVPSFSMSPGSKAYLVGKNPGEIMKWPGDPSTQYWTPVWAILIPRGRKKGDVIWVHDQELFPETASTSPCGKKEINDYFELVWHSRMRLNPPEPRKHRELWTEFLKWVKNAK